MGKIWLLGYVFIKRGGKRFEFTKYSRCNSCGYSLKVDIFIPKSRLFDQEEMNRAQAKVLEGRDKPFNVASPEGTILNKLEWYKMGGGVSDRQWNDIQGVLKVRGTTLDMGYLRRWAAVLDVSDLLERALSEAGLSE